MGAARCGWGRLLLAWGGEYSGKSTALLELQRMDFPGRCRAGRPALGFGKAWTWAGWGQTGFKKENQELVNGRLCLLKGWRKGTFSW